MSDQGFQAFKGESNELVMEERPQRGAGGGDATSLHMQNFLAACRSRNHKDLNDEIANAALSASMCHLANISYRVGRKLTLDCRTQVRQRSRRQQTTDTGLSQALCCVDAGLN